MLSDMSKNSGGLFSMQDSYSKQFMEALKDQDILIFDSDVSKEYLRLYENETLKAEELDDIRVNGLKRMTIYKTSAKKEGFIK